MHRRTFISTTGAARFGAAIGPERLPGQEPRPATGAAVGVSNGWGDGFGLTRLPRDAKEQMLRDIASLG